jgi:hypothetical protein
LPYPKGTLGVGFSTLIGDTGEHTMAWMQDTHIGVILLSTYPGKKQKKKQKNQIYDLGSYAVIVQVMLVNLLIGMF